MKAWFYKLIGSDAEVPWEAGTDLPENVQLGNPDFLNQFIKRTNLRVAAMRMLGHSVSFAPEYGVGETYLDNLWRRCSDAISGPGAYYWNTTGPDGEYDGDTCYAVHGGFSGPGAGDASPQDWMRTLREEITARTNVVRKCRFYTGTDKWGPAGAFITGNCSWFKKFWRNDASWSAAGYTAPYPNQLDSGNAAMYPHSSMTYLRTVDGALEFVEPIGRYIMWSNRYDPVQSSVEIISAWLYNPVASLAAPYKSVGFDLHVYAKGIRRVTNLDYLSVELPVENQFYHKKSVSHVATNTGVAQWLSLSGTVFGTDDQDELPESESGAAAYRPLAMLKIDIDESTTPD